MLGMVQLMGDCVYSMLLSCVIPTIVQSVLIIATVIMAILGE